MNKKQEIIDTVIELIYGHPMGVPPWEQVHEKFVKALDSYAEAYVLDLLPDEFNPEEQDWSQRGWNACRQQVLDNMKNNQKEL